MKTMSLLPEPDHYDLDKVTEIRYIDYQARHANALDWRRLHNLRASSTDTTQTGLLLIDEQNTFCNPNGELFVAGQSGRGAIEDAQRLTRFIYGHLGIISRIHCTLDTHRAYSVFHPTFLVDQDGRHPAPFTPIDPDDVAAGKWLASPFMASALGVSLPAAQRHLEYYCRELKRKGRYSLTIWPFHGMLGGIGHALISGLEEACFFHAIARGAQTGFEVKGTNPWVERYSILGSEVLTGADGRAIDQRNTQFIEQLLRYDILIIAGQAKSHCVAWTISDLLESIVNQDKDLAKKIYLLEDCTSPVVVPGMDYTREANDAFARFRDAEMNVVKSTDPIWTWPGVNLA